MLYIRQLELGPMKNFVYLLGRTDRPETAVVDPAWDVPAILAAARQDGRTLTHALLTHRHFDHTHGVVDLLEAAPVQIFAHEDDADHLACDVPTSEIRRVASGDVVEVGGLGVRCIHTPGHTPGSQSFLLESEKPALFSGDTLFVDACGRCDLEGGDPHQMYDSLSRVLGALPGSTRLFPGHDYGHVKMSSLERERASNPYLRVPTEEEFVAFRMRAR